MQINNSLTIRFLCAGLIGVCTMIWLIFLFRYSINADNAVLIEFAQRLLAGGKFGLDFVDTNPPYNIFLYIPVALLAYAGIPVYYGVILFSLSLLALACLLSWHILKRFDFIDRDERIVFLGCFALASVAMGHIAFGERDQIILFSLLPFLLTQFALNTKTQLNPGLKYTSLIWGALMILIKPHYGLMPTLMILVRPLANQGLLSVFRSDFWVLSTSVIGYAALNILLFPDYWTELFPYLYKAYIFLPAVDVMYPSRFRILFAVFVGLIYASLQYRDKRKIYFMLMLSCSLAALLIAYSTQYKGFYYHLLPALIMGGAITALMVLPRRAIPGKALYALALCSIFLMANFPPKLKYPTHDSYMSLPIGQEITDCPAPCSFLINTDTVSIAHETAAYTGGMNASRYASLWFEVDFACGDQMEYFDYYTSRLAEDFRRFKPEIVMLYRDDAEKCFGKDHGPARFEDVFAKHPDFAKEWAYYRLDKHIQFNRRLYFGSTTLDFDLMMDFDIFRRVD